MATAPPMPLTKSSVSQAAWAWHAYQGKTKNHSGLSLQGRIDNGQGAFVFHVAHCG